MNYTFKTLKTIEDAPKDHPMLLPYHYAEMYVPAKNHSITIKFYTFKEIEIIFECENNYTLPELCIPIHYFKTNKKDMHTLILNEIKTTARIYNLSKKQKYDLKKNIINPILLDTIKYMIIKIYGA